MSWLKKYVVDWFLKDQLKGLPKALNGYKTTVGIVLSLFSIVLIAFPSNLPFAESILQAIAYLELSFEAQLTDNQERQAALALQLIVSNLILLWGIFHKVWKKIMDEPQKPEPVLPDVKPYTKSTTLQ